MKENCAKAIYRKTHLDGSKICRGAVEHLSTTKEPRWIEQLLSRQKLS